jgi:hypothetical protein
MGKNPDPGSRINIPDNFSESLGTLFWVKNTYSLMRIRNLVLTLDPGWKKSDPG